MTRLLAWSVTRVPGGTVSVTVSGRRVQQVQPQQLSRGVVAGHSFAGSGIPDRDDVKRMP